MSGHEINHVLEPIFSESPLLRILGPDSFEWDVNKGHQQQIEQKPIHADGHTIERASIHLYARAAPSCCSDGEKHSRQRQTLFFAQEGRDHSKCDRRQDEELDQKANCVQQIGRTEFGRGQELREMEAQDATEGKKSKKDGQYSTPPTRSKTGGLGIAEEFINFLLDHDVSQA